MPLQSIKATERLVKLSGCSTDYRTGQRKREEVETKIWSRLEDFDINGSRFLGTYVILAHFLPPVSTNKELYCGAGLWVKD